MSDTSTSGYRLTAPTHQMYDTSVGEATVLRGMTPENMGGMYGLLLGQRADAAANQEAYDKLLRAVNNQQAGLAQQRLANDELKSRREATLGLVQHGGMGVAPALNAMQLPGLPGFLQPRTAAEAILSTDDLAALNARAKAFQAFGQGAQAATGAGFEVNPGQVVAGPEQGLAARYTTGTPLDLRQEAMRQAGETARAHGKLDKITGKYNPLTQEIELGGTFSDPQRAILTMNDLRRIQTEMNANLPAVPTPGRTPAPRTGTPPPRTGAGQAAGVNRETPAPAQARGRPPGPITQGEIDAARRAAQDAGGKYDGVFLRNGRVAVYVIKDGKRQPFFLEE